ncbi:MAG: hypothetical protein E6246_02460 [Veillonella sp.]|nr:hypothetical protein [Veillonella sp.]
MKVQTRTTYILPYVFIKFYVIIKHFIDPETGERTAPKRALENLAKEADKDIKEHKDIH